METTMKDSENNVNSSDSGSAMTLLLSMLENPRNHHFEDSIEETSKKITKTVSDSQMIKDDYGNSLLSIGTDDQSAKFTNYSFSNDTLNWPLWLALYNESWVFRRAIDKPAQDEIRCGITLVGDYDKENVYRMLKNYRDDLIQLLCWGALFGGSLAFVMFDNFTDDMYKQPFNKEKVKQSKAMKLYVVDRWYGIAPDYNHMVTDMSDADYGKPKYYDVTMPDGKTYKFHHDYVIRYEHRFAPKLIKNGMLQGWGYSEGSHILNELVRDEKLKTSIQSLMDKSLIEVIKMSGMRGLFMGTDKKNEAQLQKRLEMVNWGRNFNSLTFLDKDDEYSMNEFSGLSGLSDLLQQNMWQISAALEMQGVLFGDLKNGWSVDTEALERYDEVINGRCESYVRSVYNKLLKFIFTKCNINDKIEFTFNSLLVKKQDKDKVESLKNFVDLCSNLLNDGVINTKQFAKALQNYSTNSTIDFGLTDDVINKLDEDFDNQFENIDLSTDKPVEVEKNERSKKRAI